MLTFRRMKKSEKKYAIQLARDAINIELKRLDKYQTYLIYNNGERIGFVSFGFRPDKTIYIYILAFEKHAQRQGFGSVIIESILKYGREKDDQFRGLSVTINKANEPPIYFVKRHGFLLTRERANYLDYMKPVSEWKGTQR